MVREVFRGLALLFGTDPKRRLKPVPHRRAPGSPYFLGAGERLELTHRAQSRECLARGALRAGLWLVDQPPGLYGMADVLGL